MERRLMRKIIEKNRFESDIKRIKRAGRYNMTDFLSIVNDLANDIPLAEKHHDHSLSGDWQEFRECHIKPNWLLIYQLEPGRLILARTGSHSELFG